MLLLLFDATLSQHLFLELLLYAVTEMYQLYFPFRDKLLEIISMQTIFNSYMKWDFYNVLTSGVARGSPMEAYQAVCFAFC